MIGTLCPKKHVTGAPCILAWKHTSKHVSYVLMGRPPIKTLISWNRNPQPEWKSGMGHGRRVKK